MKILDLALSIQIEAHNEASTFSHEAIYFPEISFQLFKTLAVPEKYAQYFVLYLTLILGSHKENVP